MQINDIKANGENPRKISKDAFEKLKMSIQEDPQMLEARPLVIDENNMVLGGNMRLRALQDLGIEDVPVKKVEGWTEEQKKRFIVKDNLSGGEWDYELLSAQYDVEELINWGLEERDLGLGEIFDNKEVDIAGVENSLEKECPKCGFKF